MSDPLERAFAAQEAFAAALAADDGLVGVAGTVPVTLGYPLDMRDEIIWVSCAVAEGPLEPADSSLGFFSSRPALGGGVSVTQYAGEDWTNIRNRLTELAQVACRVLREDRTLGGTCTSAWISAQQVVEDASAGTKITLRWLFKLTVQQYVTG